MAETRTCLKCQGQYEPEYYGKVGGVQLLKGSGYCPGCAKVAYEEEVAREKAAFEALTHNTRHEHIAQSGIPYRFMTQKFKTFEKGWQDKALAFCEKYAEDFPVNKRPSGVPSLYLWAAGNAVNPKGNGTGKSHLSCAIAHRIFERWTGKHKGCPRIYFVSESDLFRQIQATYSFSREEGRVRDSEDDIVRKLTYCDLLILDDVGKERRSDPRFIQRTLFSIIDGRYKLLLPLVLTANVNGDGLRRHLEDASFDRFFEMIEGKSVCMDGQSYRRKK